MKTTLMAHLSLGPYKESVQIVQIQMPFHTVGLDAPSALRVAHMFLLRIIYYKVYVCQTLYCKLQACKCNASLAPGLKLAWNKLA